MTTCDRAEALRDYAFDELAAGERREMERHLTACTDCAAELDQLRLTTAALRILPDREIPQRIAFVSDKIFEPSPAARFFRSGFFSSAWAGFASAAIMAVALLFTAFHRPAEIRTVVQTASAADVNRRIDAAVATAVADAVRQVRAEDAKTAKETLAAAELRYEREHRFLLASMEQNMEVLQKRLGTFTSLASLDVPQIASQNGAGQ